jgi:NADPH:quinone reductase-like Zn-dependent oxidoreductase
MKAAVCSRYGPPDVVLIEDVEKPVPKKGEVLIEVRAASVNPLDWHTMRGSPYIARMMGGLLKPKDTRLGVDVAGRVEAVGENVGRFKPGDEVYGLCRGALAEYACTSESAFAAKAEQVTFEQAAAAPVAALTALQGLRDKGRIQPGQKVLINGASGGVGTFAVQIAKWFGADVTGVCSSGNLDLVRTLGADRVVDYTQEDFTRRLQGYDLLLDCVGNHSLFACRRVLGPKGRLIVITGPNGLWLGPVARLLGALILSRFVSQDFVPFIAKSNREDLTLIQELMKAGKVVPVIDKCYPLSELPTAIHYLEEGHARGKVVILPDQSFHGQSIRGKSV